MQFSRRARALLVSALAFAPAAGRAQSAPPRAPDRFCWRGRPQARCDGFLLFELSAPRHVAGTHLVVGGDLRSVNHRRWTQGLASQWIYDLGYMRNVAPSLAVGGTIETGFILDDPSTPGIIGVTGRVRRWVGDVFTVDAGVGVSRTPVGVLDTLPYYVQRVSVRRPAITGDVRLGVGDLIGVTARAMAANDGRGRTHGAVLVGASVGSVVTAAVTGTVAAFVGYFYIQHPHGDEVSIGR